MDKFFQARLSNLMGDSSLDDHVTKQLMQDIEGRIGLLLDISDMNLIKYNQGYIAALRTAIEKIRQDNKRNITSEDNE